MGDLLKQEKDLSDAEEVLVDDFDGQCCRTYPYNHSRIQRWQRENRKAKVTEGTVKREKASSHRNYPNVKRDGGDSEGAAQKVSKPSDSTGTESVFLIRRYRTKELPD